MAHTYGNPYVGSREMNVIPYGRRATLSPMRESGGRPSAGESRSEALRAIVRAISAADHGGVQRATAKALGVAPGSLNDFLNKRSGAGQQLQDGLVAYLQRPIEEIVSAHGDLPLLRSPKPSVRSVDVHFRSLPLWPVLLAGAKSLDATIPAWCWAKVEDAVVWVRIPVTSAMVVDMARFFLRHESPPTSAPARK